MASLPATSCTPRACAAAKPGTGLYASAGLRKTETRTAAVSDRLPDPRNRQASPEHDPSTIT